MMTDTNFSKAERRKLDALANSVGQDTSTWAREQLLAAKKKQET
jgi:hypothetical protein